MAEGEDEDGDGGNSASGYPITQKFMQLLVKFSRFVLEQFNTRHNRFTEPIWLWGVDDIDPAPKASERYTKPILLLINELDFSGGDFFPTIMQDNHRATTFGVRTAGAGGVVNSHEVENQLGIADFSTTGTLAIRANGQPIENLGVKPDIDYAFTAKDIKTGFAECRLNILKALKGLMGSQPAPEKLSKKQTPAVRRSLPKNGTRAQAKPLPALEFSVGDRVRVIYTGSDNVLRLVGEGIVNYIGDDRAEVLFDNGSAGMFPHHMIYKVAS
jgi:hypothetical protein